MKEYTYYAVLMIILSFNIYAKKNNSSHFINPTQKIDIIHSLLELDDLDDHQRHIYQNQLVQLLQNQPSRGPVGTGSISGTVVDSMVTAISDHTVTLYQITGQNQTPFGSVLTDPMGMYVFNDLPAGVYAVVAGTVFDDYLDYLWQSPADGGQLLCSGCRFPESGNINLADAESIGNIDFSIGLGGVINGNISDALTMGPVLSLTPQLINNDFDINYSVYAAFDEVTGDYSIKGIPDGDYRMYLSPNFGMTNQYIPQVYGGPECNSCFRVIADAIGTTLSIAAANTVNNINFSLNVGASISGRVVDAITLNSLQELAFVMIFDQLNQNLAQFFITGTNGDPAADGSYTIGGLLPGSYYVQGGDLGREFYQRELFANKPCYWSGCDRGADGDPVVLSAGENRVGVNFLLEVGGKISGNITDASTGMPPVLPNFGNVWLTFYDDQEEVVGGAFMRPDGSYVSARGLPPGNYAVRTGSMFVGELTSPFVNEKYNDVPCPALACDLSTQDVMVAANAETTNIDFALSTGFSFSGTITDTSTGLPIPNVNVLVYRDMGPSEQPRFANWATTSDGSSTPEGSFEVSGLPTGTYYAVTNNGSNLPFFAFSPSPGAGWVDILYNGMPCPAAGCDIASGTPIVLPAPSPDGETLPTVDFTLSQGANITGKVISSTDAAPISEVSVNVFNDQGELMGNFSTDINGEYKTSGFPAGTYYLTTNSFEVMVDVMFGGNLCYIDNCNPLDAMPIELTEQQSITDINFTLKPNYLFGNSFE